MGIPTVPGQANVFKQSGAAPTTTAPRPGVPLPGAASVPGAITLVHSLENVEQSTRLEPGQHPAYIESVEEVRAKSSGAQGIQFKLRFIHFDGVEKVNPNDGRSGKHTVYVTPKALWKVKNTFCAVGQCDAVASFNAREAENVLVIVDVTTDRYLPEGKEDIEDNYVHTSKCDTLIPWPLHLGGPGVKLQVAAS